MPATHPPPPTPSNDPPFVSSSPPTTNPPPPPQHPTITTARLLLRLLSPTDLPSVHSIRSDPRVLYWTDPDTPSQSTTWLHARLSSPKSLVYTVSPLPTPADPTPSIVGITGAHNLPEVGYIFHPSAWGRGYATESLRAWIEMYWGRYGGEGEGAHPALEGPEREYLKAVTGPGGEGSRGVLRKCGFLFHGEEEVEDERKGRKEVGMRVVLQEFRLARPGPGGEGGEGGEWGERGKRGERGER